MGRGLTTRAVEAVKAGKARREIPDGYLRNLYLVVQPKTGAKSWCVRYRIGSKSRKHTLGAFPAIDLRTARELAAKALRAVAEGRDPGREKQEARSARVDSFDSVLAEFLERHVRRANRPRTAHENERMLRQHVLPYWRGRLIRDITRRDILDILDRIIDSGAPIAANRVLAIVRKMFAWCVSRDILTISPCAGVKPPAIEKARDRVLSDDELRLIWQAAERVGHPYGPLVKMLTLTGQRRDEVARMTWDEVDIENRLWRLPPERMKTGQPHDVPLSNAAIAVLKDMRHIDDSRFVFTLNGTSPSAGFSTKKYQLDALLPADMSPWRLHDLRRTAASSMARIGINLPVIEKVLGHRSGTFKGVLAVYQRHDFADEKRAALEAWGNFVAVLVEGKSTGKVVRLRGKRP
jgi:integrase